MGAYRTYFYCVGLDFERLKFVFCFLQWLTCGARLRGTNKEENFKSNQINDGIYNKGVTTDQFKPSIDQNWLPSTNNEGDY